MCDAVLGTDSLEICGCSGTQCTQLQDYGWRVGTLKLKGPASKARHVEVFAASDILLPLNGDFDDKFYLLLKKGDSCETGAPDPAWNLQGFAPISNGMATWAPFSKGEGVLSVCLCHDTVAGLSDPFGDSQTSDAVCRDASMYALKVGQVFVNGPLVQDTPSTCRRGSVCYITIRYIAVDSGATRQQWASSQIYLQKVSQQSLKWKHTSTPF